MNKVAGNLHIAPGKSFQANHMHIHDINSFIARGETYGNGRRSVGTTQPPHALTQGRCGSATATGALT